MASGRRRRKRRILLAVEIIILVVLSVSLVATAWVYNKLSLVNYDSNFDRTKVKTSTEAKQARQSAAAVTPTPGPQKTETSSDQQTEAQPQEVQEQPQPEQQQQQQQEVQIPESNLQGIDMIALVGLDTRPEYDAEGGDNSDTMIICCINHNDKTVKLASIYRDTFLNIGEDYDGMPDWYTKANTAYNVGGAEQFLTMVNLNLDLDITEYVTVEFKALATAIEMLGGIDVDLTYQEIVHLNNYNIETSAACDMEYVEIELPPLEELNGVMTRTYHLNGSQAVSYARIRYTDGFDFRRASRQRLVLSLLKEKAKNADILTINNMMNAVLPMVTTNMDSSKIFSMAWPVLFYSMTEEDQTGFPFVHLEDDGTITGSDCILPITLSYNVQRLHEFLFPGTEYWPSEIVEEYNAHIIEATGYDETFIEPASEIPDDAAIPKYDPAAVQAELDQAAEEEAYYNELYGEGGYYYDEETGEYVPY